MQQNRGHVELLTPISMKPLLDAINLGVSNILLWTKYIVADCTAVLLCVRRYTSNPAKQYHRISSEPCPRTTLYYSWYSYVRFYIPVDEHKTKRVGMSIRPEDEREGAVGIAIRRARLRVVLNLCFQTRSTFPWPQTKCTAISRTTSTKRFVKYDNNEARPRERSDRVRFFLQAKKPLHSGSYEHA